MKSLKIYKRIEIREEKRIAQEICFGNRIELSSRPLSPSYFLLFLTRNSFTLALPSVIDNSLMERGISLEKENEIFGFKGREWWRLKVPYCLFLGSFQTFPGIRRDPLFPISRKLTAFSFPFCSCEYFDSTHIQFEKSKKNEQWGKSEKEARMRKLELMEKRSEWEKQRQVFSSNSLSVWVWLQHEKTAASIHSISSLSWSTNSNPDLFFSLSHSSIFFAGFVLLFFRSHPFLFPSLVQRKMNDSALT